MGALFSNAEFWVGVAFLAFIGVLVYAKVPGLILGMLDGRGQKIQSQLDEASRLRSEAEALLAEIKVEREAAERRAAEILAAAETDAERMRVEAAAKLEDQIKRRAALAERKIAQAQAQAAAEVKSAAGELAAQAAEAILAARLSAAGADPLVDTAIKDLAVKLS